MYQKVFNSKIPTIYDVHTDIGNILAEQYLHNPDFKDFSTIQSIDFLRNEKTIQSKSLLTTIGCFHMPKYHLKMKLMGKTVTTEERLFINEQLKQLRNILNFLPNVTDSLNYNKALLLRYLNNDKLTTPSFKFQDATTSISNEILFDLREVITRYIYFLNIDGIKTNDSRDAQHYCKRNFNYVEELQKIKLVKENYDMTHIHMTDDEIIDIFENWNYNITL